MRRIIVAKLIREAYYVHEMYFLNYTTEYYKRKAFIPCNKTSIKFAL